MQSYTSISDYSRLSHSFHNISSKKLIEKGILIAVFYHIIQGEFIRHNSLKIVFQASQSHRIPGSLPFEEQGAVWIVKDWRNLEERIRRQWRKIDSFLWWLLYVSRFRVSKLSATNYICKWICMYMWNKQCCISYLHLRNDKESMQTMQFHFNDKKDTLIYAK